MLLNLPDDTDNQRVILKAHRDDMDMSDRKSTQGTSTMDVLCRKDAALLD